LLPLGRIGLRAERGDPRSSLLTADEQKTMLTLWSMARSPLMVGGDLPSSDAQTIRLLANPTLSRVLDDARDSAEIVREPSNDGEVIVWAARSAGSDSHYVALFWTGTRQRDVAVPISSIIGSMAGGAGDQWRISDLWDAASGIRVQAATEPIAATVPSHGVAWYALQPAG
jgi:hypothetical protein